MFRLFLFLIPLFLFISCSGDDISPNTLNADLAPVQTWIKSYNGSQEESHGHFITESSDGGFLQVGETGFIPSSARVFVVKTDAEGDLVWQKEIGVSGHNLGNSITETADGYLLSVALGRKATLVLLDKGTGDIIWSNEYDPGGTSAIEQTVVLDDKLYAIGYRDAEDEGNTFYTEGKGHMLILDTSGALLQSVDINDHISHAYRIVQNEGSLFVSGLSAGAEEYLLLKINMDGEVIWRRAYGGSASDHCFAMDINTEGDIFLSGHTLSGTENWDTYTLKLNSEGEILWEAIRGNPRGFNPKYIHDEAWGVRADAQGGCVVVAGTGDEYGIYSKCNGEICSDQWEVYLISYREDGAVAWEQTYRPEEGGDWAGEDLCLSAAGDILVAVDNGSFGFLKLVN